MKANAEQITMLCLRFCEGKGILNREMSLSTIEYIRCRRKDAVKKINHLVKFYGTESDKKNLKNLNIN